MTTVWVLLGLLAWGCSDDGTPSTDESSEVANEAGGVPDMDAQQRVDGGDELQFADIQNGSDKPVDDTSIVDSEDVESDVESEEDSSQAEETDIDQGGEEDSLLEETEADADVVEEQQDSVSNVDSVTDAESTDPVNECGVVATYNWPAQSGVVYVSHYATNEIRWYRIDGEFPYQEGAIQASSLSHGSALDPVRDILAVAYDVGNKVELFGLTRPENASQSVPAPVSKALIDLGEYTPRTLAFDSIRGRLYIVANAPVEGLLTSKWLHVYDVTTPESPMVIAVPQEIPVTVSIAIDPYAGILGLLNMTEDTLHLYNAQEPTIVPFEGEPVNLQALYPQTNSSGFQVREVKFDAENGRILAARSQTALSEVVAFDYPSVFGSAEECPELFGYDDLELVVDGFDVDQEPADWDNLLGAYTVLPIPGTTHSMFVADAWNGSAARAAVFPLDGKLIPREGCGDYGGKGCFYRDFFESNPVSYERTDGAACVDASHGVVVGTSVNAGSEDDPGGVHFFKYDSDLKMEAWIPQDGKGAKASGLPIGAECH